MRNSKARPTPLDLHRRVVFLHIAKTAGTSVVHFFRSRLPEDSVCSHGDFLNFPEDRTAFQLKLQQYQFLSGHFGYSDVAPLLHDSYAFTFLRDPVDRVLSFYKFCLHPDMQKQFPVARAAKALGLEGFLASTLPEVCEMLDNQQTWQLARTYWQQDRYALRHLSDDALLGMAKAHLAEFNHVGLTETFDDDFRVILLDLDINVPVPKAKQFSTLRPITREQLRPSVLASLQNRLALDYNLVEFARSKRRNISMKSSDVQSTGD
jgi:hypothetical protein